MLLVLFATALAWRLAYVARISKSPLDGSMFDDARIYWAWSERIAQGWLLGSNPFFLAPLYPYVLALLHAFGLTSHSGILIVQGI